MATAEPPPKGPRPLEIALATAVAAWAMLRAPALPTWRADAALLRATDLAFGASGNVSALLGSFARLLPLGTEAYRQSLPTALAAGLAAACAARLARGPLAAPGLHPWLGGLLAAFAALGACLSSTFQRETLAPGGGALAASLALATFVAASEGGARKGARSAGPALAGALWVQTLVESPWAALAVGAALLAAGATAKRPRGEGLRAWALGAVAGALPWALLAIVRAPMVSDPWAGAWAALSGGPGRGARGLWPFVDEVGLPTLMASACGLALAARKPEARGPAWLLLASLPACRLAAGDPRAADPFAATRALAIVAVGLGASAAVGRALVALSSTRLPLGRAVAAIAGLLALARVVMAADEGWQAGAASRLAVEAWTDEALEGLPAGSALLVREKPFADRLLVAQAVEGRREDLLVVPLDSVTRRRVAAGLLSREPSLSTLVREQALYGEPSEYALASLASSRPLYVEGGPGRARRVASHASPESLWLRFSQQPVGSVDRRAGQEQAGRSIERVLTAARAGGGVDEATRRALVSHVVDQLELALSLDERELVEGAWARLLPLEPDGSWLPADDKQARGDRKRRARR